MTSSSSMPYAHSQCSFTRDSGAAEAQTPHPLLFAYTATTVAHLVMAGEAGESTGRRGKHALTGVLTTSAGMEYSVHSCPRQYIPDLKAIFPGKEASKILIVPTCQKAAMDLINTGPDVDVEKDRLLEEFVRWAAAVSKNLIAQGFFADYIDPCSGLPMINKDTTTYYGEVDALQTLMGYSISNAGCCKVVLHPQWGSRVYPATLFTDAPLENLLDAARSS